LTLDEAVAEADEKPYKDAKNAFHSHGLGDTMAQGLVRKEVEDKSDAKQSKGLDTIPENKNDQIDDDGRDNCSFHNYSTRRCTLTCCAPDGSPLQGSSLPCLFVFRVTYCYR
jgi:hypothetical protein